MEHKLKEMKIKLGTMKLERFKVNKIIEFIDELLSQNYKYISPSFIYSELRSASTGKLPTASSIAKNLEFPLADGESFPEFKELQLKFNFHFSGKKKTNQVGKFYYFEYCQKLIRETEQIPDSAVDIADFHNELTFAVVQVLVPRMLKEADILMDYPGLMVMLFEKALEFDVTNSQFRKRLDKFQIDLISVSLKQEFQRFYENVINGNIPILYPQEPTQTIRVPYKLFDELIMKPEYLSTFKTGLELELSETGIEEINENCTEFLDRFNEIDPKYASIIVEPIIRLFESILNDIVDNLHKIDQGFGDLQNELISLCDIFNNICSIFESVSDLAFHDLSIAASDSRSNNFHGIWHPIYSQKQHLSESTINIIYKKLLRVFSQLLYELPKDWTSNEIMIKMLPAKFQPYLMLSNRLKTFSFTKIFQMVDELVLEKLLISNSLISPQLLHEMILGFEVDDRYNEGFELLKDMQIILENDGSKLKNRNQSGKKLLKEDQRSKIERLMLMN